MRPIRSWCVAVLLCLGCARGPEESAEAPAPRDGAAGDHAAASASSSEQAKREAEELEASPQDPDSAGSPEYLGKPLPYWTAQAAASDRREDVSTIVEALVAALGDDHYRVMVDAADALEALGPEAAPAAPALAAKLDHVQPWVRVAAMDALTAIGAPAVPSLVEAVKTGPGGAPVRAAIVLGNIGPAAREASAALEQKMKESSEDRRWRYADALDQIAGAAASGETERPGASADGTDLTASGSFPSLAGGGDWPQFHGPNRDSLCGDTGLFDQWPSAGLKLLWRLEGLGRGYSTVSIAGGRLFTMGDRAPAGGEEAQFVLAYDLASRKELWSARVGRPHVDGPRSTPTIDGGRLYALGTEGDLVCLEVETGAVVWRRSLVADFDGAMMSGWKYAESPLVDGDRVICTPGGEEAALVALDKRTGETIWRAALPELGNSGKDGAAYSSAVAAEIDGVRQYVQMAGRGVVAVAADSGKFLWGYNPIANPTANIPSPLVRGRFVFVANGYGAGAVLLSIAKKGDAFQVEAVYHLNAGEFGNHHGGVVLVGDCVYGGHGQNRGVPTCVNLATGEIAWKGKPPARGSASVVYASGHILFRYDRGLLAWVRADPDGFHLDGSFQPEIGDGPAWAHPVIHDGRLYLRHDDLLLCYDLRGDR